MSCAKLSSAHCALVGYIVAKAQNRHYYTYEIHSRAVLAAKLNNQSVNARYGIRGHAIKIDINYIDKFAFWDVSLAQQVKAIDAYLYNTDNAPTFEKSEFITKLRVLSRQLSRQFSQAEYDDAEWFIESLPLKQPKTMAQFEAEYSRIHCVDFRR